MCIFLTLASASVVPKTSDSSFRNIFNLSICLIFYVVEMNSSKVEAFGLRAFMSLLFKITMLERSIFSPALNWVLSIFSACIFIVLYLSTMLFIIFDKSLCTTTV